MTALALLPDRLTAEALYSVEAEQAVLCAMMQSTASAAVVARALQPDDFGKDAHARLFFALCALHGDGVQSEVITVSLYNYLDRKGWTADVGGLDYLSYLLDVVPSAANLEYHCKIVRERSVQRRLLGASEAIGRLATSPDVPTVELVARAQQVLAGIEAASTSGASAPTLTELREHPELFVAPASVIPRLAWSGRVTMLSGREKLGKSTLLTAACAAKSRGRYFLGEPTTRGTVLWLSADREALYDVDRRLEEFGADPDYVRIVRNWSGDPAEFLHLVREHRPDVAVVDTLASYGRNVVREASQSADWLPLLDGLTHAARDTGTAIELMHHASKGTGGYRDSTAVGAGVDAILEMRPDDDPTSPRRTVSARGRFPMSDFTIRLEGGLFTLDAGLPSLDARMLAYIELHPSCTANAAAKEVGGRKDDALAAIGRLERAQLIENRGAKGERKPSKLYRMEPTGSAGSQRFGTSPEDGGSGGISREPPPTTTTGTTEVAVSREPDAVAASPVHA